MVKRVPVADLPAPLPPGATLRETLAVADMSQAQLAKRLGFSVKHVNQVIQGTASLSPTFALGLEYSLGVPAEFWCALETHYQLSVLRARQRILPDLVARLEAAGLTDSAHELGKVIAVTSP